MPRVLEGLAQHQERVQANLPQGKTAVVARWRELKAHVMDFRTGDPRWVEWWQCGRRWREHDVAAGLVQTDLPLEPTS